MFTTFGLLQYYILEYIHTFPHLTNHTKLACSAGKGEKAFRSVLLYYVSWLPILAGFINDDDILEESLVASVHALFSDLPSCCSFLLLVSLPKNWFLYFWTMSSYNLVDNNIKLNWKIYLSYTPCVHTGDIAVIWRTLGYLFFFWWNTCYALYTGVSACVIDLIRNLVLWRISHVFGDSEE